MPFMAAAIPYIVAAGAAVSAAAAYNQGQQQKKAANYQAEEAADQAKNAANVAGANAVAKQEQNRVQIGSAAAALAQSGGGFGGTGLLALNQSAVNQQLDTMNIQYGGVENANASNNQVNLDVANANNAGTSGMLNAAGQLFSGAGGVYRYTQNPAIASPGGNNG